jgi:hypothetical protein
MSFLAQVLTQTRSIINTMTPMGSLHGTHRAPFRVPLRGFVLRGVIGLGDFIKRAIHAVRVTSCESCNRRELKLNSWLIFSRTTFGNKTASKPVKEAQRADGGFCEPSCSCSIRWQSGSHFILRRLRLRRSRQLLRRGMPRFIVPNGIQGKRQFIQEEGGLRKVKCDNALFLHLCHAGSQRASSSASCAFVRNITGTFDTWRITSFGGDQPCSRRFCPVVFTSTAIAMDRTLQSGSDTWLFAPRRVVRSGGMNHFQQAT